MCVCVVSCLPDGRYLRARADSPKPRPEGPAAYVSPESNPVQRMRVLSPKDSGRQSTPSALRAHQPDPHTAGGRSQIFTSRIYFPSSFRQVGRVRRGTGIDSSQRKHHIPAVFAFGEQINALHSARMFVEHIPTSLEKPRIHLAVGMMARKE